MSLRVDDKQRSGRSRSRSRQRSRDDRAPSPNPASKTKEKRSVQIVEDGDDDDRRSSRLDRSAPRDDPAYDDSYNRSTKNVIPGLSSLGTSARGPPSAPLDDRDNDSYYRAPKRDKLAEEAAQFEVRSPHGIEMPTSPTLENDTFPLPGAFPPANDRSMPPSSSGQYHPRAASFAVPYPTQDPTITRDRSYSYTPMPGADWAPPGHQSPPAQYQYARPPDRDSHDRDFYERGAYERNSYETRPYDTRPYDTRPYDTRSYDKKSYDTKSYDTKPYAPEPPSQSAYVPRAPPTTQDPRTSSYSQYTTEVREVRPKDPVPSSPPAREGRSHRLSVTERGPEKRGVSPGRLDTKMGLLAVGGAGSEPRSLSNGGAPASPLLEAYQGTYQQMSPMPSPMMLASDGPDDIPPLTQISEPKAATEREDKVVDVKITKKKVKIYDAEKDAMTISEAMSHSRVDTGPLIEILPELTHDQLLELRNEYKKHCKVQGRGVNIAKHIKVKTDGNFGKICYVTALGRWESEAYWANFWYQSHSSSRELLIEALMGRPNADIREIKDSFKDKRYKDSLSKCMETELKPDKFRTAVLLALEERRQEETDHLSTEARNRDVDALHRALTARDGGETAIIQIVVTRSDAHLRDVLKTYERLHGDNFAREALKKSNNLVGEVIAHILNGAINRPARDTLLLRHALDDIAARNRAVELRHELLISRLVRLHWDRLQLARVKQEYRRKYGNELERDVRDATRGDYGAFCLRLCES